MSHFTRIPAFLRMLLPRQARPAIAASVSVIGVAFTLCGPATGQPAEEAPSGLAAASPSPSPDPLAEKLTAYFLAKAPRDQARLLREIGELPEVTIEKVAAALPALPLWEKHDPGVSRLTVPMPRLAARQVEELTIALAVPEGYDPAQAYPLVLVLADDASGVGAALDRYRAMAGDTDPPPIIAAVPALRGVWLSSPPETCTDPLRVLDALKRLLHVDTNRVYLAGDGQSAHAACVLAAMQPDPFAGLLSIGGTLALQMPAEAVAGMFLPNLRTVQTLLVFPPDPAEGSVATWNRYLAGAAEQFGIPVKVSEASVPPAAAPDAAPPPASESDSALQSDQPHSAPATNAAAGALAENAESAATAFLEPPADAAGELLAAQRPAAPSHLSLWFRYPEQGRIGWLVQTRFDGDPWTAQQLLVAPAPTETVAEAAVSLLKEKLAFLGGEVAEQEIRITQQRCDRIELRLPFGLVNFDEPITVLVDGTKRFEGKVTPKLSTMLSIAREDWEFQRLYPVRLRLSAKGRAVEE